MTQPTQQPEAKVVADLAQAAARPHEIQSDLLYAAVVPNGARVEIVDLEKYAEQPVRKRGTAQLTSGDSFAAYVKAHADEKSTAIYADIDQLRVVCLLNGHTEGDTTAGWGDHRVVFTIRQTPQWKHWKSRDGQLGSQTDFAEHIEAGLLEIITPDGATMLEIAQSFYAKTNVDFKTATRLDTGERQFRYEEEIKATAGRPTSSTTGALEIPETFELNVSPFEGADPLIVQARLRYRISNGQLLIGYALVRPDDVVRNAFEDVVKTIEDDTGYGVYRGTPPA